MRSNQRDGEKARNKEMIFYYSSCSAKYRLRNQLKEIKTHKWLIQSKRNEKKHTIFSFFAYYVKKTLCKEKRAKTKPNKCNTCATEVIKCGVHLEWIVGTSTRISYYIRIVCICYSFWTQNYHDAFVFLFECLRCGGDFTRQRRSII